MLITLQSDHREGSNFSTKVLIHLKVFFSNTRLIDIGMY